MKLLILTSKKHRDFVKENSEPFMADGDEVDIYWDDAPCLFSRNGDYDFGVSFMYTYKVPREQLDKPWFNFHPAPLPAYKGRNLCYHAIMNGEKEFGATIHYMDENFDTGDIIEVLGFAIQERATAEDLSRFALSASMQLFQTYIPRILAGEKFTRSKNIGGTCYKYEPIKDEIDVPAVVKRQVRAITFGEFYPVIDVGGLKYKIVRDT
jgi:methionyl-tRNA formyltransferase